MYFFGGAPATAEALSPLPAGAAATACSVFPARSPLDCSSGARGWSIPAASLISDMGSDQNRTDVLSVEPQFLDSHSHLEHLVFTPPREHGRSWLCLCNTASAAAMFRTTGEPVCFHAGFSCFMASGTLLYRLPTCVWYYCGGPLFPHSYNSAQLSTKLL
eukprot:3211249-Rhodomonas_salina.3